MRLAKTKKKKTMCKITGHKQKSSFKTKATKIDLYIYINKYSQHPAIV